MGMMGMARVAALADSLLRHLPADTPAAVVQSLSLPRQVQLLTTLARLAADVAMLVPGAPGR